MFHIGCLCFPRPLLSYISIVRMKQLVNSNCSPALPAVCADEVIIGLLGGLLFTDHPSYHS